MNAVQIFNFKPSNTSGAIQAALPLLLVIYVFLSQAVPKSHIFNVFPSFTNSKFGGFKSLKKINHYLIF